MNPANFPTNLKRKQDEAQTRNAEWAALPLTQQLAALDRRPGKSAKQRAKILARIQEQKKQEK